MPGQQVDGKEISLQSAPEVDAGSITSVFLQSCDKHCNIGLIN